MIVTGINCLAVRVSGGVAAVLSGIKIALVLVVGIGAFLLASGADWSHLWMANVGAPAKAFRRRPGRLWRFHRQMLGAMWAYDGWNNVTLVAGEVRTRTEITARS
jgi:APA family basic amino acid/polyamine antiporter